MKYIITKDGKISLAKNLEEDESDYQIQRRS